MYQQISNILHPLIGLPLWKTHRAGNIQVFQFGGQRPTITRQGETVLIGDYGLHLQCSWRIVKADNITVGSGDLYYPAGDPEQEPPDFNWDKAGANRRDDRINALFLSRQNDPFIVEVVTTDSLGGGGIFLSGGYKLELSPYDSLPFEHWRLLDNIHDGRPHYVVTGVGVEIVPESDEI